MKKSKLMKWLTIIILVIATISLVGGGFIMLLGQPAPEKAPVSIQTPQDNEIPTQTE